MKIDFRNQQLLKAAKQAVAMKRTCETPVSPCKSNNFLLVSECATQQLFARSLNVAQQLFTRSPNAGQQLFSPRPNPLPRLPDLRRGADQTLLAGGERTSTAMRTPHRTLAFSHAGAARRFAARRLLVAGYTGRDQAAVDAHVAELARQGVPPPERTPWIFVANPETLRIGGTVWAYDGASSGGSRVRAAHR